MEYKWENSIKNKKIGGEHYVNRVKKRTINQIMPRDDKE